MGKGGSHLLSAYSVSDAQLFMGYFTWSSQRPGQLEEEA